MPPAQSPYAPPAPRRTLTAVSADGTPLHVETHGPDDAPAVVLVHGWTCSTAFWAPVVRALADGPGGGHRVIAYDLRGHGRSPAPGPGGYSTRALADDLAAVLGATLAEGERAVLAGHSMGGMTVVAAADRPFVRERTAAALLCSTGVSRLPAEALVLPLAAGRVRSRLTRSVLGSRAPLGPVTPLGKRVLKYATLGPYAPPAAVAACARIVHACDRGVRAAWGGVLAELDLDANIRELSTPTAIVVGTADRLTPAVHARRLAARLPDCAGLTELPGLGHMTPVEDPAAVAGAVRELVAAHLLAPQATQESHTTSEERTA
ncbi:alpha/beta fold hydrolase [Streptomyces varsoviensis]|uniref:alpha/beta fold hydrolase n=1 Tax=Streptomyces varsoviensis TaxID=67373 RepID=UPI0004C9AAB3|nr:alpha/beta hydrolase [Streptomyces varsoviensis]